LKFLTWILQLDAVYIGAVTDLTGLDLYRAADLVGSSGALAQTSAVVSHVDTGNALRVQRSVAPGQAFLVTTVPLTGCHAQLTVARSTNQVAPRRANCQPRYNSFQFFKMKF